MRIELSISELDQLRDLVARKQDAPALFTPTIPFNYDPLRPTVLLSTVHLVRDGLLINAIREHRAYTSLSLKESKDVIDLIRDVRVAK